MKKIFRLVLAGLIAIIPALAIWLFMIKGCIFYIDKEYPYTLWNKQFCQTDNGGAAQVLIIGDSVLNSAMCPDYLSESTYNLTLGGVTSGEMYYVLKEYLEHNQAPKVCYIGFSDIGYIADQNFYNRCLYFHRFSDDVVDAILADAERFDEKSFLIEDYKNERLKYRYWSPEKYLPALINGGFFMRYKTNTENYRVVSEHKGSWMSQNEGYVDSADEIEYTSLAVGQFENYYMQKILDLCVEYEITPRVVMVPMRPNNVCTMEYIEDCYKYFVSLQEYCPQVTYFYRPEGFGYECFSDDWHMNNTGSVKYSQIIKETFPQDFE